METETISYEEKEQQLVNDCVKELRKCPSGYINTMMILLCALIHVFCKPSTGDSNRQIGSLAEELAKKTEDANRQQEEITHLLSQIVDLQKKAKGVGSL